MKTLFFVLIIIFIGGALWVLLSEEQTNPDTIHSVPEEGMVTLSGTIVCLPHKDTSGPQTLECAFGLKDENEQYYALTTEDDTEPPIITSFPTGTMVTVAGDFTKTEDPVYDVVGLIEVDSITPQNESASSPTETTSDGTITFARPEDFGLAISDEQIPASSNIPPCASGFSYCLYYMGDTYEHTNLDSAGLAIRTISTLNTEAACLNTSPEGYTSLQPVAQTTKNDHTMSLFAPVEDAGAGHYTTGEIYRLFTSDRCYELTILIGESQFENYPEGDIVEFTSHDRNTLLANMRRILEDMTLDANDAPLQLPQI